MTDTATSTPSTPKKSSIKKKLFWIIAIILGALGIDHYTFNYVSGGASIEVAVTDSTIAVTPKLDTTITITAKKDTTKK